jgi:hypothetical protein
MNDNRELKVSSRAGRFKKKLVSLEELSLEAPKVADRMKPILDLYTQQKLSAAETTAYYILIILSHRFPKTWLGSKKASMGVEHRMHASWEHLELEPNVMSRLKDVKTLGEIFDGFALKSTPLPVNRALLSWSSGSYPLELMFTIPAPLEVLAQQVQGRRCVTVLTTEARLKSYVLGERDALSFTMHDLIHADHFYHSPVSFQGQLGFYGLLEHCLKHDHFKALSESKEFQWELDYFISDMNAYAVHLMKCLKSAIIHYGSREAYEFWLKCLELNEEEHEALNFLYQDGYVAEIHDSIVLKFLDRWKKLA